PPPTRPPRAHPADIGIHGFGGPQMGAMAGEGAVHDWIARAAVLGIIDVLKHYAYFSRQFNIALAEIARLKPDAVILIDYPGFNLRLAKALKKARTRAKVIEYI